MVHVIFKDGIRIAFDESGKGVVVIIINGAMRLRKFFGDKPLHSRTTSAFTRTIVLAAAKAPILIPRQFS
ncbi:MAG TPA: hypothetical protein VE467_15030 [Chryseolinea sp.]|nr:hypothetical protein [Chryseolinea sp.]